MKGKIDFFAINKKGMNIMLEMEQYLKDHSTLDPILYELIKTRVSQINGCAFCLNMHTKDALKLGETNQRLFLLNAWRETSLFTVKEKLALELAEKATLISINEIEETLIEELLEHFSEKEFTDLILAINQINAWNRINISIHSQVDHSS